VRSPFVLALLAIAAVPTAGNAWLTTLSGPPTNSFDEAHSIVPLPSGDVAVASIEQALSGDEHVIVRRFDAAAGMVVWQRDFGANFTRVMKLASDGNPSGLARPQQSPCPHRPYGSRKLRIDVKD
jgi:hypothetical protein